MSIAERDFILRAIQQIGEALARIAGLRRSGQADVALLQVQQTLGSILGPMLSMIERLDASSAALMLSDPAKIRAYGLLIAERSAVQRALGNEAAAGNDRLRALQILGVWLQRQASGATPIDDDVQAALQSLRDA